MISRIQATPAFISKVSWMPDIVINDSSIFIYLGIVVCPQYWISVWQIFHNTNLCLPDHLPNTFNIICFHNLYCFLSVYNWSRLILVSIHTVSLPLVHHSNIALTTTVSLVLHTFLSYSLFIFYMHWAHASVSFADVILYVNMSMLVNQSKMSMYWSNCGLVGIMI